MLLETEEDSFEPDEGNDVIDEDSFEAEEGDDMAEDETKDSIFDIFFSMFLTEFKRFLWDVTSSEILGKDLSNSCLETIYV